MNGYAKLFSSILDSTVWREDDHTRIVWVTMLAMADKLGNIYSSIPGLADRARVPVDSCERAIQKFLSPDKYSRSREHDGRRIGEIDGGWRLLNFEKYRNLLSTDPENVYQRELMRKRRAMERGDLTLGSVSLTGTNTVRCTLKSTESTVCTEGEGSVRGGVMLSIRQQLDSLYHRQKNSWWGNDEERLLVDVSARDQALNEMAEVSEYIARTGKKFETQSVRSVLTNWTTILDKSRITPEEENRNGKPKPKPKDYSSWSKPKKYT